MNNPRQSSRDIAALVATGIIPEDRLHDAENIIGTSKRMEVDGLLDDDAWLDGLEGHLRDAGRIELLDAVQEYRDDD